MISRTTTTARAALLWLATQLAPTRSTPAQQSAQQSAQQAAPLAPVRQLGPQQAVLHDTLRSVTGIRQLSDGRVMINDGAAHRLLMADSLLAHAVVIADSTASTNKAYGTGMQAGAIIAYRADSTVFVDPRAVAFLVLDPNGHLARTLAPPRPSDVSTLVTGAANPGFDAAGRLLYRDGHAQRAAVEAIYGGASAPTASPASGDASPAWARHDSAAVLRGNLATHIIDTAGFIAIPLPQHPLGDSTPDGWIRVPVGNPFPSYDDFVVVADGSVAFLRARDYHIDWIDANGVRSSTPKIAHDWHHLSDGDKAATVDSLRVFYDSMTKVVKARAARNDSLERAHGEPVNAGGAMRVLYQAPGVPDLPDYLPPVGPRSLLADADDNVWIRQDVKRPSFGPPPPSVYDIVDRQGRLIDRVQIPAGQAVAGFGHGVVYLTSREAWGTVVAKYRIR